MGGEVAEFSSGYVVPISLYIKIALFLVVAFAGSYLGLLFLKKRNFGGAPSRTVVRESVEAVGYGVSVMVVMVEGTRFAIFKSKDQIAVERLPEKQPDDPCQ